MCKANRQRIFLDRVDERLLNRQYDHRDDRRENREGDFLDPDIWFSQISPQGKPIQRQQHHRKREGDFLAQQRQRKQQQARGIPPEPPMAARLRIGPAFQCCGVQIGEETANGEDSAEHIAALGEPRDGFDPHRMDAEHKRRQRCGEHERDSIRSCLVNWRRRLACGVGSSLTSARDADGQQLQRQEIHQHRVDRVQDHAGKVIPAGFHLPDRVIDRERQPRQRLVMAHVAGGEHPSQVIGRETAIVRIGHEGFQIVPIEELRAQRRPERQHHDGKKRRCRQHVREVEPPSSQRGRGGLRSAASDLAWRWWSVLHAASTNGDASGERIKPRAGAKCPRGEKAGAKKPGRKAGAKSRGEKKAHGQESVGFDRRALIAEAVRFE